MISRLRTFNEAATWNSRQRNINKFLGSAHLVPHGYICIWEFEAATNDHDVPPHMPEHVQHGMHMIVQCYLFY